MKMGFAAIPVIGLVIAFIIIGAIGFTFLDNDGKPGAVVGENIEMEQDVHEEISSETLPDNDQLSALEEEADVQQSTDLVPDELVSTSPNQESGGEVASTEASVEGDDVGQDTCANGLGNGAEIISGPSGPDENDRDNPFHSLTVHPTNPNHILVGTERNGFLRSTDGGISWERLRYGLIHSGGGYPEIYDIGIAESNPNIIYAATVGSPGPLTLQGSTSGVYKSTDGGQTWQRKNCGIENNGGRTTAVYVDPLDSDHALIAISGGETSYFTADQPAGIYIDGGIYETTDGGEQWTRLNIATKDEKNRVRSFRRPSSGGGLLYLLGFTFDDDLDIGFLKSTDGGKTWQQIAPTVRNKMAGSFGVSADGMTLYAHSNEYKIYKSTDGGITWTTHQIFTSGYTATVSPLDSRRVLYGQVDGLYLSTNGLETVTKVLDIDENGGRISDLVFAPSDPSTVYMITGGYIVYKSTDAGANFVKIGNLRDEVLNE